MIIFWKSKQKTEIFSQDSKMRIINKKRPNPTGIVLFSLIFLLLIDCSVLSAEQRLVIAGTGDSQELLRVLGIEFSKANPGNLIVIPDTIGSLGGIKSLKEGKVKLARTARPLKDNERPGLTEILFARTPIVFTVHPSLREIDNLTHEQVLGIYSGKYRNWSDLGGPDHKIYIVDREAGDSARIILEKHMPGFKNIQTIGIMKYNTQDAVQSIEDHKFTLGYLPMAPIIGRNLKPLSLDGVAPSLKNIAQGTYKYAIPFYLVSKGKPEGLSKRFLDYLFTARARDLMIKRGVMPVR